MRSAVVLLLVTVVAHGSQLLRPDWSGTEAFRTLIAHGMVESGDYLIPRLGGELMLTKPPLFYWALAVADQLFGLSALAMRVPSVLALWLCACAVHHTFARRFDVRTAWIAALGLVCAPVQLWHGAFAEIDPPFAALTVISIVWLAEAVAFGGRARFVAAGLVGSLALLTKGPPYLMFLAGVLPLWLRHAGVRGLLPFVLALVGPFAAYYVVLITAPGGLPVRELSQLATDESVGRIAAFDRSSLLDAPLHVLRAAALTLPFGLWGVAARPPLDAPRDLLRRVCLWAFGASVLALLVFPMRPVRYLMPGLGLAIVSFAPSVAAWLRDVSMPGRATIGVVRGFGVVAAVAVAVLPWTPYPTPGWSWWGALVVGVTAVLVRTRGGVVAFALLAPVVMVWTVGVDRDVYRSRGNRSDLQVAALLRAELDAAGASALEVWGHTTESIALELDPSMRWRLDAQGDPGTDWVLVNRNDGGPAASLPAGFVLRSVVRGHGEDYLLAERVR